MRTHLLSRQFEDLSSQQLVVQDQRAFRMSIRVSCEFCFHEFNVKDEFAGKRARCSECREVIRIPQAAASRRGPSAGASRSQNRRATPAPKSNTPLLIAGAGAGVLVLLVLVAVIAFRAGGALETVLDGKSPVRIVVTNGPTLLEFKTLLPLLIVELLQWADDFNQHMLETFE